MSFCSTKENQEHENQFYGSILIHNASFFDATHEQEFLELVLKMKLSSRDTLELYV